MVFGRIKKYDSLFYQTSIWRVINIRHEIQTNRPWEHPWIDKNLAIHLSKISFKCKWWFKMVIPLINFHSKDTELCLIYNEGINHNDLWCVLMRQRKNHVQRMSIKVSSTRSWMGNKKPSESNSKSITNFFERWHGTSRWQQIEDGLSI